MTSPSIATELGLNLASERLGARVIAADDEFFAPKENLVRDAAPVWDPDRYVDSGKWMDGWETRRRRDLGPEAHDACLVRLAFPGRLRELVIETAHFAGNFPESAAVDAVDAGHDATAEALAAAPWEEVVPRSALEGDRENRFAIESPRRFTHLRLRIYPDGGVARVRAWGEVVPRAEAVPTGRADLASLALGARVVAASDRFYSAPEKALQPDDPTGMFDGWETRRRRGPGNDWMVVRLAGEGVVDAATFDTRFFRGNAPGWISLEGARGAPGESFDAASAGIDWSPILPRTAVAPDREHELELAAAGPFTHVRLQIYPDGGVARLRLHGELSADGRAAIALAELAALSDAEAERRLLARCGSGRWARTMAAARPFADLAALLAAAEAAAEGLGRDDWLEAFAAHPRIGEREAARDTGARAAVWSAGEQAGVDPADERLRERLAEGNRAYEERFGFLYIVCATGRTGDELRALLEKRLDNDPDDELRVAAGEQRRITELRLRKWMAP